MATNEPYMHRVKALQASAGRSSWERRIVCAVALLIGVIPGFTKSFANDPLEDEPDDRLPHKERRLVAGLIQRGMPELIEVLLAGHPSIHREHVARAYAKAGIDTKAPAMRDHFFSKAAEEYRKLIKLDRKRGWLKGERRRFKLTAWRVEFGDLILRHWIVPDLDQFEITSGLEFDRDRVFSRLQEAYALYLEAGEMLKDLDIGLRTDEERYLLLGIADKITILLAQQELNTAWTGLYLAMMSPAEGPQRLRYLNEALSAFDLISRAAQDSNRKYNALLGAGIALRELGRLDEAEAAFDRVFDSTASRDLTTRASYERARTMIQAGRFDFARRELDRLALQPTRRLQGVEAGAIFYIRLAPLIHAYTYIRQAQTLKETDGRRKQFQQKAQSELNELYQRGGSWVKMTTVYLDAISGAKRDLDQLTATELTVAAGAKMNSKDYKEAIRAWQILLAREDAKSQHPKAQFNLGVCFFQSGRLRDAAETFLAAAHNRPPPSIAEKTFEYAYRCWRELAASSKSREDYLTLAEASGLLARNLPEHRLADEAGWVSAIALDEAGEYERARLAYGRVPPSSLDYWSARRNTARCRQRLYEALPTDATTGHRRRNAERVVETWLALAEKLSKLNDANTTSETKGKQGTSGPSPVFDVKLRESWINEARMAAAAVLASDDLREYEKCQALLAEMPHSARVLGLHIRCLQGRGDIKQANRVLEDYLQRDSGAELGSVLVRLAAEMETEIERLKQEGRRPEAKRMAIDTIPTIRHLLDWIKTQPQQKTNLPIVRFSLVKILIQAEKYDEAAGQLESLMSESPDNGIYVRTAALLQEDIARSGTVTDRSVALDRAESLWAELLRDRSLRTAAPNHYWEARYYWLKHQLRHGRAADVLKGIQSERAWRPDLGGPPWQGRLLDLADQAREKIEAAAP